MFWKSLLNFFKRYYLLILVLLVFGTLYSLISLYNHWNFRTGTHMMGTYLNAMYDYLRFSFNDMGTMGEVRNNLLANEFDLYLIILSPLTLLFGTYTLIIVQIAAILFGGVGVYRYLDLISRSRKVPLFGTLHFFLFFGIFSALYQEYHSMVVAGMFIPWFLYSFKMEKYGNAMVWIAIMLIAKETMAIFLVFVFLGMIFEYFRDKKATARLVVFALISYLYMMVVGGMITPMLSAVDGHPLFGYLYIGDNMIAAFKFILGHPIATFKFLLMNHTGNPAFDDIKKEFLIYVFLSGGFLLFARIRYMVMIIPLFFLMLLHDNPERWSVYSYSSALFAPIISIGAFHYIDSIEWRKNRVAVSIILLGVTVLITMLLMESTVYPGKKEKIAVYKNEHYEQPLGTDSIPLHFKKIPGNAIVSAQSEFLPHLALRDNIYKFPLIQDARYIVISDNGKMSSKDQLKVDLIKESTSWEVLVEDNGFYIFKSSLIE
ncbi:MAG: DUF2079 domain-containing protein [Bacteroidales bacterium]|nr:DUF2079 domain-containing protein [Bacteroidales bacterium]MCF8387392.1 DUF2079 domain-containing protein [Bacteroidales bacterium]MCF8398682.1 DUF2079 domain-containing protein [Bacteroidales bacterium]